MKLRSSNLGNVVMVLTTVLALNELAFAGNAGPVRNAPTLDEYGLLGLGVAIGVAGLIAVFRRKR